MSASDKKKDSFDIRDSWYRVGYVEISFYQKDGSINVETFEGLDFKFKITQIIGRMPEGNMSVSICGLSHDTANKIVTLCNTVEALAKRKTVRVFAGYRDPKNPDYNGTPIAEMDIINATITTPPPDIWLQITGVYAAFLNNQNIGIDITGERTVTHGAVRGDVVFVNYLTLSGTLKEITDRLNWLSQKRDGDESKRIKYTWKMKIAKSVTRHKQYKTIGGFTMQSKAWDEDNKEEYIPGKTRHFRYKGTIAELPTKISEVFKVNALWEYKGEREVCLAVYSDPKYLRGVDINDLDFIGAHNVKYLSVDTGLVGIPKLKDSIELQCRFLLDEHIAAGDYVCVNSVLMDAINGMGQTIKTMHGDASVYQIMKITYTGHLRGNEWYCDVCARRPMDIITHKQPEKPRTFWITQDLADMFKDWELNEQTGDMLPKNPEAQYGAVVGGLLSFLNWFENKLSEPTVYERNFNREPVTDK